MGHWSSHKQLRTDWGISWLVIVCGKIGEGWNRLCPSHFVMYRTLNVNNCIIYMFGKFYPCVFFLSILNLFKGCFLIACNVFLAYLRLSTKFLIGRNTIEFVGTKQSRGELDLLPCLTFFSKSLVFPKFNVTY